MKINADTELTTRATMFSDGAGFFNQRHNLLADGEETGVIIEVSGGKKIETTRTFIANGGEYENHLDALKVAGHDVDLELFKNYKTKEQKSEN